jgi:acetyl esterase/lipase
MSTHDVSVTQDIEFANVGGTSLKLDLYRPAADRALPALVWIHGGGFQVGDKGEYRERFTPIAERGFVVASMNYRLLGEAPWPAQIHDANAAVRWLRANAAEHGVDPDRIAVGGGSAGGQLASLVGLTTGDAALEGEVGDHTATSSAVSAVVAMFPATDLIALGGPSELEREILPPSAGATLLGIAHVDDDPAASRAISPRHRVHAGAPPHLLLHGDRDMVMHVDQSRTMHDALSAVGAHSALLVLAGQGHESEAFAAPTVIGTITGFLAERA